MDSIVDNVKKLPSLVQKGSAELHDLLTRVGLHRPIIRSSILLKDVQAGSPSEKQHMDSRQLTPGPVLVSWTFSVLVGSRCLYNTFFTTSRNKQVTTMMIMANQAEPLDSN
uniref:Uncharacterized protein n=1 Tax=Micrurus corallinus TaxID=54390 RepID=A0A2D4FLH6_MICCO